MRKLKQFIGVFLCAALCLSAFTLSAQAKTAKKYVKSVSVAKKSTITIPADSKTASKNYKVSVKVVGAASKAFTVKSSKTSVATVKAISGSKIKVTAKKAGTAKITVTTKAKNAKGKKLNAYLTVTVKKKKAAAPTPTEPEVDEREGTVTEETVPLYDYVPGMGTVESESRLFFSTAYPDVPFVADSDAILLFTSGLMYDTPEAVKSDKGLAHRYDLETDTSVIFDYENKIIYFSDYTSTLTFNGFMTFNPFAPTAAAETQLYRVTDLDRYYGGDPMIATFAYDEVPMLRSGDNILIPLQSFSDLFFSFAGGFYQYNGEGIYVISVSTPTDPNQAEFWAQYCDVEKRATVSKEFAQVNYYELCNALDARYGLQEAHNIDSFDVYFTRKGIKEKMLSGDLAAIEKATMEISVSLFEDFHSSPSITSPLLDGTVQADISIFSPLYVNRSNRFSTIEAARGKAMGDDIAPYERRGDTVFITFDAFSFGGVDKYYEDGYEPTPYGDTVDLFAYALRRLQNEDSDAKNVVIALACNGGGAVYACGYVLQAICGQSKLCVQNPNTWALHQCVFDFDLNLDGEIDQNDASILDMGFNVAVNMSDHSFSCGNLLPNMLNTLDDRILFIGQTSGGGACEVGYLSTATGSMMQISSEYRFVTMKNGYIRDIDGGLDPDIYLTLNKMFDRDYIVSLVNEQFG